MTQDLLDPDAFRAALHAAAGPSTPPDDVIDRARAGAHRRSRRRVLVAGGVVAGVVAAGAVLTTSLPALDPAPSTRPTAPVLTPTQRAQQAFEAAVATAVPTFPSDAWSVSAPTWTDGAGNVPGWQATLVDNTLRPGTAVVDGTTLSIAVSSSAEAPASAFPTCGSTDPDRGVVVDDCVSRRLPDGTRVDSGTLTSTFWVQTAGVGDPHQVSVTAPFATATTLLGTRASAAGGVVDWSETPLTMGTTLPAGSPLTVESLRALVSDRRLLDLRD